MQGRTKKPACLRASWNGSVWVLRSTRSSLRAGGEQHADAVIRVGCVADRRSVEIKLPIGRRRRADKFLDLVVAVAPVLHLKGGPHRSEVVDAIDADQRFDTGVDAGKWILRIGAGKFLAAECRQRRKVRARRGAEQTDARRVDAESTGLAADELQPASTSCTASGNVLDFVAS